MKRFHVHLHVDDLAASIAFYARLFGTAPTRSEADYAKWMLDDPRLNFAISTRGAQPGMTISRAPARSASWIAATCADTADSWSARRRLNSSKQPHAPVSTTPVRMRPKAA
jgi:predicted enzyme related to lactoylglutathione lyase